MLVASGRSDSTGLPQGTAAACCVHTPLHANDFEQLPSLYESLPGIQDGRLHEVLGHEHAQAAPSAAATMQCQEQRIDQQRGMSAQAAAAPSTEHKGEPQPPTSSLSNCATKLCTFCECVSLLLTAFFVLSLDLNLMWHEPCTGLQRLVCLQSGLEYYLRL